ncbi:hypothetical protein [Micromonospora sp. WMMD736]|uniref:type II secretion system F family protein n=1 Tax=Micromonospora sp. WMMD736 TaxID=3404112 RepID=UPI003B936817
MNATMPLVAALLLATATLVVWRAKRIRDRRRRVLVPSRRVVVDPDEALVEWIRDLARAQDRPTDEVSGVAAPAQPGVLAQPTPNTGRTAVAWSARDLDDGPGRSRAVGGPAGPTRPAGPARPPARRDSRRPAASTGPEVTTLKAVDSQNHAGGGLLAEPPGPGDGGPLVTPAVRARRSPRRVLLLVGLAGAGVGTVSGGPVAAVAMAGYGTLATRALLRWRTNRQAELSRRHTLDLLCGLAADLRAGLPVPPALGITSGAGAPVNGVDRLRDLTSAAVRLADRTGAPLAELIERIEADARATDRGLAAAAAQAAGARATAWLLAALPIGGIGLGYGIGVDPLAVLLHDTVGGVCAVLAVGLQIVGLFWAERLGAGPGRTT